MTVYCYDTEFLEDGSTIDLISIGIVCEDGREYYAVNSDMDIDRIKKDDWLCKNVVPLLPLNNPPEKFEQRTWIWSLDMKSTLVKPKWVIRNEILEFFMVGHPELWAYYGAYDHVALAQFWGKMTSLPKWMPMWTHELMQLIEHIPDFELPDQILGEHNALEDARWNMKVYQKVFNEALK